MTDQAYDNRSDTMLQRGKADPAPGTDGSVWRRRSGLALSGLAALFFLADAAGKVMQVEPVMRGTADLGWPTAAVVPLGLLLLVGTALYVTPRTCVLGAIYLTGFLGGAIATHYRIGSPLATHVLFGLYVAAVMWAGLLLRYPALAATVLRGPNAMSRMRQGSAPAMEGGSGRRTAAS